jgi:hypothetical protein
MAQVKQKPAAAHGRLADTTLPYVILDLGLRDRDA